MCQLVKLANLNKVLTVSVADSPLSVTNLAELTSLNDYPLGERPVSPTGNFIYRLDSFYDTDNSLSVINLAELASLNDYPLGDFPVSPTDQFK